MSSYDAILLVGFGGPEGPDDVMPFLKQVTSGRNIPDERLRQVSAHYQHFGGVSPINSQLRALRLALETRLSETGTPLPVFWGNRNWHPFLKDTISEMADAGHERGLAVVTSAFSSYSGCGQYLADIAQARQEVGTSAPQIDKVRNYFNHPGFIDAQVARVQDALQGTTSPRLVFTAHSLPESSALKCAYEQQLREAVRLVASAVGHRDADLVYQSRSGSPRVAWLEPDINDHLKELAEQSVDEVVVVPIGFVSDHMEVVWDLDMQASETASECGISMVRAKTVGTHPLFIDGLCSLINERASGAHVRQAVGRFPALADTCAAMCCE